MKYYFVCGDDDFLVEVEAKKKFTAYGDDFSKTKIDGSAKTLSELQAFIANFKEAVQTIDFFSKQKLIWLKNIQFLSGSRNFSGKEGAKLLNALTELLNKDYPAEIILSAAPVDRRTKTVKWLQDNGKSVFLKKEDRVFIDDILDDILAKHEVNLEYEAKELLFKKLQYPRLIAQETEKLCCWAGTNGTISKEVVLELTADVAEDSFFEPVEAFFSGDREWAMRAFKRYFIHNKEARPLLSSLQHRNRLLIQLHAFCEGKWSNYDKNLFSKFLSKSKFEKIKNTGIFEDFALKSTFCALSQNPWYLNKIFASCPFSIKQLLNLQLLFTKAFKNLLKFPKAQNRSMELLIFNQLVN